MFIRRAGIGAALASLLLVASQVPGNASTVTVSGTILSGGGNTSWDPGTNTEDYCPDTQYGYSAVTDGSTDVTDGFDNGMIVGVNGNDFDVKSGQGNLSGQQLKVGPTKIAGVKVTRIDRALSKSPTLRSLVVLKNPSAKDLRRTVSLHSDLGSDMSTTVVKTSSGNAKFTRADRWIITDGDTSDPPVTHVFFGAGAASDVSKVTSYPGITPPYYDCVGVNLVVHIPARSTRYVLFFAQMHKSADHTDGYQASKKDAQAFNDPSLNAGLLTGLSPSVRQRIVNWNLG